MTKLQWSLAALALAGTSCSASSYQFTTVVNDFDEKLVRSSSWGVGWYTPCHDSYGDVNPVDFHVDWAGQRGEVNATYALGSAIEVPGCYAIDEWHPGASAACSMYLPKNAPLTIYHTGGASDIVVDQSVNGGMWNRLGNYRLDSQSRLLFGNNGGKLECATGTCWWVADAYRLTYLADTCDGSEVEVMSTGMGPLLTGQCSGYKEFVGEALELCGSPQSCDDWQAAGPACHSHSKQLIDTYKTKAIQCLLEDAEHYEDKEVAVLNIFACPLLGRDDEEDPREPASSNEMQSQYPRLHSPEDYNGLQWMNSDCSNFEHMARAVLAACPTESCCPEVGRNPMCAYMATSLYAWYTAHKFNQCMRHMSRQDHHLASPYECEEVPCRLRGITMCVLNQEVYELMHGADAAPHPNARAPSQPAPYERECRTFDEQLDEMRVHLEERDMQSFTLVLIAVSLALFLSSLYLLARRCRTSFLTPVFEFPWALAGPAHAHVEHAPNKDYDPSKVSYCTNPDQSVMMTTLVDERPVKAPQDAAPSKLPEDEVTALNPLTLAPAEEEGRPQDAPAPAPEP